MSSLSLYQNDIDIMKAAYQKREGQLQAIESTIQGLETDIDNHKKAQELNAKIISLLQKGGDLSRSITKSHLEQIGTMALKFVFDKDIEFAIDLIERAGRAEADFYIQYSNGTDIIRVKPEDSSGGGVIDVLSTSLRFAFMELLTDPFIQGPIELDEPGKMISEMAATKMAELLKEFNKTFVRQAVMVTHNDTYAAFADKNYLVSISNGESQIIDTSTFASAVNINGGIDNVSDN